MSERLEADYLVVGGGAMGMAFADEILHGSKTARVVVVDRRAKPGGHWNDAYRFVTLHQPALFYGVNSRALGAGGRDLVSQAQILAYYELVLKDLEATGRFTFLSRAEVDREARGGEDVAVRSLLGASAAKRVVRARKVVDASYMDVRVPSTTQPGYAATGGARLVPINGLADRADAVERYVVLGAGKTGIDAILYLLEQGVAAEAISWVVPNDAWFLNRDNIQPDAFAEELLDQIRLFRDARDFDAILDGLEQRDRLLRLSADVRPTRYRCATVTKEELDRLRRVTDVIREGRVTRIEGACLRFGASELRFEEPVERLLYVDCTADGLAPRPARPIYEADRITLQSIAMCQQVMSAAAIAALELRERDDAAKNATLTPVPHPKRPADYLQCFRQTLLNQQGMARRLFVWSLTRRLSGLKHLPWLDKLRILSVGLRVAPPSRERIDALAEGFQTTKF